MTYDIQIRPQPRKSLAMKLTPGGIQVLIPQDLAADSAQVQAFIQQGLSKLEPPQPVPASQHLTKDELLGLVDTWGQRLDVQVKRVQLRAMRNKWGSISTAGTLTLASDLLHMPRRLVDYVICHELLHLKVPTHNRLYRLLLTRHIPDWRQCEQELGRWTLAER